MIYVVGTVYEGKFSPVAFSHDAKKAKNLKEEFLKQYRKRVRANPQSYSIVALKHPPQVSIRRYPIDTLIDF